MKFELKDLGIDTKQIKLQNCYNKGDGGVMYRIDDTSEKEIIKRVAKKFVEYIRQSGKHRTHLSYNRGRVSVSGTGTILSHITHQLETELKEHNSLNGKDSIRAYISDWKINEIVSRELRDEFLSTFKREGDIVVADILKKMKVESYSGGRELANNHNSKVLAYALTQECGLGVFIFKGKRKIMALKIENRSYRAEMYRLEFKEALEQIDKIANSKPDCYIPEENLTKIKAKIVADNL